MKSAVLDLGTNTFHLLIAEISKGGGKPEIKPVYRETIAVQLGREGLSGGEIHPDALGRASRALESFSRTICQAGVVTTRAYATSALRDAGNSGDFIRSILAATGILIEIIDGEREAELIYRGVREAVDLNQLSLIIDIGGGSTELILADQAQIFWKKSFSVGAARMMERFHKSDPISASDQNAMRSCFDYSLAELKTQIKSTTPSQLIGSAGAFETFAVLSDPAYTSYESFNGKLTQKIRTSPASHPIAVQSFDGIHQQLLHSTKDERARMEDIPPVRKDMIISAAILTKYILDLVRPSAFMMSTYSLREGMLFELAETFNAAQT